MAEDLVAEVEAALRRLCATGPFRITYRIERNGEKPPMTRWQGVRSFGIGWALLFAIFSAFDVVLGLGRRRRAPQEPRAPLLQGDGVIDLKDRRSAVDFGAYATLEKDDQSWSGASGRALGLEAERRRITDPLAVVELLGGVTSAEAVPSDNPDELHVRAKSDIAKVAGAAGGDFPLPDWLTFGELSAVPVEVWLDVNTHDLRRVRLDNAWAQTTVDIVAGGAAPAVDWTRLPDFASRSPRNP